MIEKDYGCGDPSRHLREGETVLDLDSGTTPSYGTAAFPARFVRAFEDAGFDGIQILKRDEQPWQTVQGIEFRPVTVEAFKDKQGHWITTAASQCCDGGRCC